MPDTPPAETLIHFVQGNLTPICGADGVPVTITQEPGEVTCFACRRTEKFKQAQLREGVGVPTPLREVIEGDEELAELARTAKRRALEAKAAQEMVAAARNERNMYVIEESIHHGDYRSVRRVEVYAINPVTVDAVIQSSAYGYGSWLDPNGPYPEVRRPKLFELVEDLRYGRTNRQIGWSTFRLITKH
jgi:hypothetical protein